MIKLNYVSTFIILALALNFACSSNAQASELNYSRILAELDKGIFHFDELSTLPERRRIGRDRSSALRDVENISSTVLSLLTSKSVQTLYQQYDNQQKIISEEYDSLSRLIERRSNSASDESVRVVDRIIYLGRPYSTSDFNKLIEQQEAKIDALEEDATLILRNLRDALIELDSPFTYDELRAMLSVSSSDMILQNISVLHNVINIINRLESLIDETSDNIRHVQRYYGMFLILYIVMDKSFDDLIEAIVENEFPRLDDIQARTNQTITEARFAIRNTKDLSELNRRAYQSNIEANNITLQAISAYRDVLNRQVAYARDSKVLTAQNFETAHNTYKTVSISANLISMIRDGKEKFLAMPSIPIPEPAIFNNEQLRIEFLKLKDVMRE